MLRIPQMALTDAKHLGVESEREFCVYTFGNNLKIYYPKEK